MDNHGNALACDPSASVEWLGRPPGDGLGEARRTSHGACWTATAGGPTSTDTAGIRVSRRIRSAHGLGHRRQRTAVERGCDHLGQPAAADRLEVLTAVVGETTARLGSAPSTPTNTAASKPLAASARSLSSGWWMTVTTGTAVPQRPAQRVGETGRVAAVGDGDPPTGQPRRRSPEGVGLPDAGHRRAVAGAAADPPDRLTVSGPQTPSVGSPTLRWNSTTAWAVAGPKNPSTRPASNPSSPRRPWRSATSSPAASAPARTAAARRAAGSHRPASTRSRRRRCRPRGARAVAGTGGRRPRCRRRTAPRRVVTDGVAEARQPALEVGDGLATGARAQREGSDHDHCGDSSRAGPRVDPGRRWNSGSTIR